MNGNCENGVGTIGVDGADACFDIGEKKLWRGSKLGGAYCLFAGTSGGLAGATLTDK